jgi:glucose/arabinose dehydrogenase
VSLKKSFLVIALSVFFCVSCDQPRAGRGAGEVVTSSQTSTSFKVEKVAGGLQVPWSIVWAPDGRLMFAERPGRVRVIENGTLRPQPLFVVADVESTGESGLMGLALHPQFSSNRFIYLSYAYSAGVSR